MRMTHKPDSITLEDAMVIKPEVGPLSLRAPLRNEAPGSGVPVASQMPPLSCVVRILMGNPCGRVKADGGPYISSAVAWGGGAHVKNSVESEHFSGTWYSRNDPEAGQGLSP